MACCACCCETKQGGTCCGEGDAATCCPSGQYCCGSACQSSPCCETDGNCPPDFICCDGECVSINVRWCCELDADNNPTGNCFLSEFDGQDCAQQTTYCSEERCLEGCGNPLP